MGQVWSLKGVFGTQKGPKTAEQKIGERPVLFLNAFEGTKTRPGPTWVGPVTMKHFKVL